jgi:hypothetical protein
MKLTKLLFFVLSVFFLCFLRDTLCCKDVSKLSKFGYIGQHWNNEIITLVVKCENEIACYRFCEVIKEKVSRVDEGFIDFKNISDFWNFISKHNILGLKTASLFDPQTKNADFLSLYGHKAPNMDAYIYEFYFIIDEMKYRFKIDDVGNVSDKRYLSLLKKLNKLVNQPTFITIFDYYDYMREIEEKISCRSVARQ